MYAPTTAKLTKAASGKYIRRSAATSVMIGTTNVGDSTANTQAPTNPTALPRHNCHIEPAARIATAATYGAASNGA